MPSIPFYQVDAFASRPFAGNPAAILVLDTWLADDVMQAIAQENNIAITAFVCRNGSVWDLRWFTPSMEASFCGHGTLATAHVLTAELGVESDIAFTTKAGTLAVQCHADGYALELPCLPPEEVAQLPDDLVSIIGGPFIHVFQTSRSWFVELPDEQAVQRFVPDLAAIEKLHPRSFVVTALGNEQDFVSRHFAPSAGVPEDAVTGSMHSTLVPYWSRKLGRDRMAAFQCSPRGGRLSCELAGDRVRVGGQAITYLRGSVVLPDGSYL